MKDSFDSSETLPFGESVYLMTRTDNNNNNNKISMAQKGSVFFLSYIIFIINSSLTGKENSLLYAAFYVNWKSWWTAKDGGFSPVREEHCAKTTCIDGKLRWRSSVHRPSGSQDTESIYLLYLLNGNPSFSISFLTAPLETLFQCLQNFSLFKDNLIFIQQSKNMGGYDLSNILGI